MKLAPRKVPRAAQLGRPCKNRLWTSCRMAVSPLHDGHCRGFSPLIFPIGLLVVKVMKAWGPLPLRASKSWTCACGSPNLCPLQLAAVSLHWASQVLPFLASALPGCCDSSHSLACLSSLQRAGCPVISLLGGFEKSC